MTHFVLTWGYLALFGATLLAAMGIPTGSELVIGFAGALASGHLVSDRHHHLNIVLVIFIATAGELLGAMLGYVIGRGGGRPLVSRLGRYVLLSEADLERSERLFQRRGDGVVFFGRFVPFVRSFVGLAAGISRMSVTKFVLFTGFAATMWSCGFALVGDAVGANWNKTLHRVSDIGYVTAGLLGLLVIAFMAARLRARRGEETS